MDEKKNVAPSGALTFLFTDIEGSTKRWEAQPADMSADLARHDALLRAGIEERGGYIFKTVGDAFCAAFADPSAALGAALDIQAAIPRMAWRVQGGISVRMSLHAGTAEERDGDYFGPAMNRSARILSLVYGGQIVCSLSAAELLRDCLPEDVRLVELGSYRLKDLARPERLCQVAAPGLRADFPALKSLDGRAHNLPLQPTAFIGRDRELAAARGAVEGGCRLLTLTGPGGAGKTRLSLQIAAELLDGFEGGCWFVELSDCVDAASTARRTARALGLRERRGLSAAKAVAAHIADRRVLLVLDNLEQDLASAGFFSSLLADCPSLSIIATSREPLRLRWERVLPLPPLGLPPPGAELDPGRLGQYEAVALFIDRAGAARPDFRVTARNAPAIAGICSLFEGIPLAIELAAARSRSLSPEEIYRRIERDLSFLEGSADFPERQRTLQAAAAWSYGLLDEREKAVFRALGSFAGEFSLDSAESVVGADQSSVLSDLAAKSLLAASEDEDGSTFLHLLLPLRDFARVRLAEAGEVERYACAHARRYGELARLGRRSDGTCMEEAGYFARLDREYGEYLLAWARARTRKDVSEAFILARALAPWWKARGMYSDGIECFRAVVDDLSVGNADRSIAAFWIAELCRHRGEFAESVPEYERAWRLAAEAGRPDLEAKALTGLGWARFRTRETALALKAWTAGEALSDGDPVTAAWAKFGRGVAAGSAGDRAGAERLLTEAMRDFAAAGDGALESSACSNLGNVLLLDGRIGAAVAAFERSRDLALCLGDRETSLMAMNNLACCRAAAGEHEKSIEEFRAIETMARSLGWSRQISTALSGLAESLFALGRKEEALEASEAALRAAESSASYSVEQGWAQRIAAEIRLAAGDPDGARRCLHAAERLLGGSADEAERLRLCTLREAIGESSPEKK